MTKQNFSKKDLQRLEEKHIKELLEDCMCSKSDEVDLNILSSMYQLLKELGFNDYLHNVFRLQYLSEFDYSEEDYYNENFPHDDGYRICSITNKPFKKGYVINDGELYLGTSEILLEHIQQNTDYSSLEKAYEDGYYYYTEFEE